MIDNFLFSIVNTFWSGIANHLWQSTLIAASAWLITLFLKKNRARVRYWIWFAVSIKFLIPFSLIVSLGSSIAPEWMKRPVEISPRWNVVHTINQPFKPLDLKKKVSALDVMEASPKLNIENASIPSNKIPLAIAFFWICGSFLVLLSWYRRGRYVSRIVAEAEYLMNGQAVNGFDRIKHNAGISSNVKLASTRSAMEPGVYGVFRPVLLIPAGILKHVNESELEAILLHELEHIRCRDNLIAFIHMIVQVLFWFHPIVWWTGSMLVFERELACDESVLRSCCNPRTYAEGILKVCENFFKSPVVCVSGVIGANLKKRMEGILKNQTRHRLSVIKKLVLSGVGLSMIGIPLSIGILNAPPSKAHSPDVDLLNYVEEYGTESVKDSNEIEKNNQTFKTANKINKQESINKNLITRAVLQSETLKEAVLKKKSKTAASVNTKIQSFEKPEKKAEIILAKKEISSDFEHGKNLIPAQRLAAVGTSTATGEKEPKPGTETARPYISKGISCLKDGKLEDAVSNLDKALNIDPVNAAAYFVRGSAYQRMGKLDNAVSDYNSAIEINPDLSVAYQNRGSAYYHQGLFDKAMPDYNRAIELNPKLAAAYQDRGSIYQSQGQFDNAMYDYSRAIEINPNLAASYQNRGRIYFRKNRFDKALTDYHKAIELNPGLAVLYHDRGIIYQNQGLFDNAILDYNKALELNPDDAVIYIRRGGVFFAKGQPQQALSDFNRAIKMDPGQVSAYIYRGYCYQSIEMYEKAFDDYNRALELNPEVAQVYIRKGTVYLSLDQPQNAFYEFNTAIEMDPEQFSAYIYRGFCFQLISMYDRAVDDYNRALELYPEAPIANRLRDEIAQISVNGSGHGGLEDQQEIECRQILPMGSNIARKVCRTKADWAMSEAIDRFNRYSTHMKMEYEK